MRRRRPPAQTAEDDQPKPERQTWSFHGVFGTFDQAQLQRGFQVYKEVCSNCHSLEHSFRTLEDPDGPGYSEEQVKTLAASYQVTNDEPNDKGEIFKRPGRPPTFPAAGLVPQRSGRGRSVRQGAAGHVAARQVAQIRARLPRTSCSTSSTDYQEIGADYIYAILNGYTKPDDPQWNLYYPGHKIAMPQPLTDGVVKYTDGTPGTLDELRQGRHRVPELGGRADHGRAQEDRLARDDLPHRALRPDVSGKKRVWADAH